MLVQVMALLSLGVLCSSAPTQGHSSRELVGSIIQEVLQDMQKLNLNAVPSMEAVNAMVERCMQSHLKTFAASLAALDRPSKVIAGKLTLVNAHKSILPDDLDKECAIVQVTSTVFLEKLENFLRLLYEKIQNA